VTTFGIGGALKSAYAGSLAEPLPDDFNMLLAKIDEGAAAVPQSRAGGGRRSKPSDGGQAAPHNRRTDSTAARKRGSR
jgi:hypothetical protein